LLRLFRAALAALSLAALVGLPAIAHAAAPTKVAIIVGPVGNLTPTYLAFADAAARVAEQQGAVVARAYSPNATPANVLAAVADANVVIYFGHGYGYPSPYGGLDTARQNGWGLQGPRAHGTHGDGLDGELEYVGEDWIVANARPAPGFVMVYSNTCYAPGASEGGYAPATPDDAAQRVAHYSRSVFAMGGSAYFATDFDFGAADLVGRLLGDRGASFGTAFASDYRYVPSALTSQAHPFAAGQAIWLHRSTYAEGPPNYWYAFAGNPDLSPLRAWDRTAPTAAVVSPVTNVDPAAPIALRLSEPVSGVSAASLSLRDAGGVAVATTVTYDAVSQLVTLQPATPLALSSHYSVVAGDQIRDPAGQPLAVAAWSLSTALDADPLSSELSVVLEAGQHVLLRFHADGSQAERRVLDVLDRRWVLADQRARLDGREGSWLRLADASLGGWWVVESSQAHALGQIEEALMPDGTRITLPPVEHALHTFEPSGPSLGEDEAIAGGRTVTVDRRRVFEGRTFLRLADTEFAGEWIEANPAVTPTEPVARRILAIEPRPVEVSLIPASGPRMAFRFDADGRVRQRRLLTDAEIDAMVLTTIETRVVAGARFAVIASGELAGWALAEGPDLLSMPATRLPETAD
jgi:Big-like domain-containing protein